MIAKSSLRSLRPPIPLTCCRCQSGLMPVLSCRMTRRCSSPTSAARKRKTSRWLRSKLFCGLLQCGLARGWALKSSAVSPASPVLLHCCFVKPTGSGAACTPSRPLEHRQCNHPPSLPLSALSSFSALLPQTCFADVPFLSPPCHMRPALPCPSRAPFP